MALIDACFRSAEKAELQARRVFDLVKWWEVRVLPPNHNTFIKVLDYDREADEGLGSEEVVTALRDVPRRNREKWRVL